MSPDTPQQRIGFQERDAAVDALQEHHSLGRLDSIEFEERMTKALEAKVITDLAVLFRDLPDPRPAFLTPAPEAPEGPTGHMLMAQPPSEPAPEPLGPAPTPWYAQWWMILLPVGLVAATGGNVGFIIPMMAIWLWIIYPSIASSRKRHPAIGMPQHVAAAEALPQWQRDRLLGEIGAGRRIQAIKMYREYTGAGLRDAKEVIDHMARQIEG